MPSNASEFFNSSSSCSVNVEDLLELDDQAPVVFAHVICKVLLQEIDGLARYAAYQLILHGKKTSLSAVVHVSHTGMCRSTPSFYRHFRTVDDSVRSGSEQPANPTRAATPLNKHLHA